MVTRERDSRQESGGSDDIGEQGWGLLGEEQGGPREPQRIHEQGQNRSRKRIPEATRGTTQFLLGHVGSVTSVLVCPGRRECLECGIFGFKGRKVPGQVGHPNAA